MITDIILFALIGAFTGIAAGLLGIGGGVIVVPGLAFIFSDLNFPPSLIMQMAAGTSLASIILTAIASTFSHHQRGAVLWPVYFKLIPGLVIGTILGSWLAHLLPTHILKILFAIFLLFIAWRMFRLTAPKTSQQIHSMLIISIIGLIVGFASGLLGIGGGALLIPALMYFDVDIKQASGTSAACGIPIAITGTLSFMFAGWHVLNLPAYSSGYVYWPAALAVAIFSVAFVYVGAYLSKVLPVKTIKQAFAVLLVGTALNLLMSG